MSRFFSLVAVTMLMHGVCIGTCRAGDSEGAAPPGWLIGVGLDDEVTASPIVGQDHEVGAFVGATYRLGGR